MVYNFKPAQCVTTKFILPTDEDAASSVSNVEVAGTFNNWEPTSLKRKHGRWETTLELTPGPHQYKFLVDGEWKHDPKKPKIDNGLGGLNNLLNIFRGATSTEVPSSCLKTSTVVERYIPKNRNIKEVNNKNKESNVWWRKNGKNWMKNVSGARNVEEAVTIKEEDVKNEHNYSSPLKMQVPMHINVMEEETIIKEEDSMVEKEKIIIEEEEVDSTAVEEVQNIVEVLVDVAAVEGEQIVSEEPGDVAVVEQEETVMIVPVDVTVEEEVQDSPAFIAAMDAMANVITESASETFMEKTSSEFEVVVGSSSDDTPEELHQVEPKVTQDWKVGDQCVAQWRGRYWYNCQIVDIKENQVLVKYLDYGDVDYTTIEELKPSGSLDEEGRLKEEEKEEVRGWGTGVTFGSSTWDDGHLQEFPPEADQHGKTPKCDEVPEGIVEGIVATFINQFVEELVPDSHNGPENIKQGKSYKNMERRKKIGPSRVAE